MSIARRAAGWTIEDYLRLEEYSNVKHEFFDGQVFAMAGGTPEHGAMAMRVGAALLAQLRGRRCNVYSSDVRVRIVETGLDTYPDVSVVCGEERRDEQDDNAIVNPVVLVEVMSPNTEDYDRGEKLEHYKRIPSLREVLFVAYDEARVELWQREGTAWRCAVVRSGATAELASIGCTLDVDDLFRDPLSGSE